MYRSIMLPLDGSEFAEEAVPLATLVARTFDAELSLVHVVHAAPDFDFKTPGEDLDWRQEFGDAARTALQGLADELAGIRTRVDVREGQVVDALVEGASEASADLMVLTTHGRSGTQRFWLGSVTDGLIRRSHVPLLLVRPWDDTEDRPVEDSRFETVVVALDGSSTSEVVLPHAAAFRERFGARIVLTRILPASLEVRSMYGGPAFRIEGDVHDRLRVEARAYLERVAARLDARGKGPDVQIRVREAASSAEGILGEAMAVGADILMISTHGRGGLARAVLGSVADKVIRGAAIPLLVVPPIEDD